MFAPNSLGPTTTGASRRCVPFRCVWAMLKAPACMPAFHMAVPAGVPKKQCKVQGLRLSAPRQHLSQGERNALVFNDSVRSGPEKGLQDQLAILLAVEVLPFQQ